MKINKNDSYRDSESCLSKELKSIKINAGRWAHVIKILLTFVCSWHSRHLFVAALQLPDENTVDKYLNKNHSSLNFRWLKSFVTRGTNYFLFCEKDWKICLQMTHLLYIFIALSLSAPSLESVHSSVKFSQSGHHVFWF